LAGFVTEAFRAGADAHAIMRQTGHRGPGMARTVGRLRGRPEQARITRMGADYRFVTVWRVAGTVQEVTAVLGDADSLPRWWPSVYLGVVQVADAGPDGTGAAVELHTKGWLPYTLRWTLTITEPMTEKGFALTAAGDLNGTGRWTFTTDGPEVVISYDWRVRATKPLLQRLSWLLKPVFSANHRWAMARGEESLRLELRRKRALGSGRDAGSVPPPPAPTFRWLQRRHQ